MSPSRRKTRVIAAVKPEEMGFPCFFEHMKVLRDLFQLNTMINFHSLPPLLLSFFVYISSVDSSKKDSVKDRKLCNSATSF